MSGNNEQFNWLKIFLQLFVFTTLSCRVHADNSTVGNTTADDLIDDIFSVDNSTEVLLDELSKDYDQEPQAPMSMPQCGLNEVPQYCQIDCINCEDRGYCEAKGCDQLHCDCQVSFVHITPGGPCEHISKCPPRDCPENETYRSCGGFCERCDSAACRQLDCSSRCYCKQGYRRHAETGKCIPADECPEKLVCQAGDVLAKSGPASEYCIPTEAEALRANETIEEEKCYCEKGFKRNVHGFCINEEYCPYVSCLGMTEPQDCPRKCNTTCYNYGDPNCTEDGMCYPGCFCLENYVLNDQLACIPFEMCPPGSNPFVAPLPPSPVAQPTLENTSNTTAAVKEESDSAVAAEIEPVETGSSSTEAAGNSDAAVTESPSEMAKTTEKAKEDEPEAKSSTEAPKKPPKKFIKAAKVSSRYKNSKTSSTESSSSKTTAAPASEEENE